MTTAQIAAIISLLVAFHVPQVQVNNVQAILLAAQKPMTAPVVVPVQPTPAVETPVAGALPTPVPSCTITASTNLNAVGTRVGTVDWTSQNVTSGTIYVYDYTTPQGQLVYKTGIQILDMHFTPSPVEGGERTNWAIGDYLDFKGVFTGQYGTITCEDSVSV